MLYDFKCKNCKLIEKDIRLTLEEFNSSRRICPQCNDKMETVIFLPTIEFRGDSWSKDGYSSVKKENERNKS